MLTFLEFYQTLLGFINFKLYNDVNLVYPPKFDASKDEGAAGLGALIIETTDNLNNLENEKESNNTNEESDRKIESEKRLKTLPKKLAIIKDQDEPTTSQIQPDAIEEPETTNNEEIMDEFTEQASIQTTSNSQDQSKTYTYRDIQTASTALTEFENLFSNCTFYLSREVPRYSLEFIIRTFCGKVGWDETCGIGSPFSENDDRITHHIVDRPTLGHRFLSRVYVQPQWVYDCVNVGKLLKTESYQPGTTLPPHLSPFVEYKEGDYVPDIENEFGDDMKEMKVANEQVEEDSSSKESDSEDDEKPETLSSHDKATIIPPIESNNEDMIHQMELEAETTGISFSKYQEQQDKQKINKVQQSSIQTVAGKKRAAKEIEEKEVKELAKVMMTKKQKTLYNKIQYGKKKQQEKVENLQRKKQEIISQQKKRPVNPNNNSNDNNNHNSNKKKKRNK